MILIAPFLVIYSLIDVTVRFLDVDFVAAAGEDISLSKFSSVSIES